MTKAWPITLVGCVTVVEAVTQQYYVKSCLQLEGSKNRLNNTDIKSPLTG